MGPGPPVTPPDERPGSAATDLADDRSKKKAAGCAGRKELCLKEEEKTEWRKPRGSLSGIDAAALFMMMDYRVAVWFTRYVL